MRQPYWCWYCQRPRADCGGTNGSCPHVEAQAAEYRIDRDEGRVTTLFNTRQLAVEREAGVSGNEMARDIIDAAERDGREIDTEKGYGG